MYFTIDKPSLTKALAHVASVVERRNTIPILSNVHLATRNNELKLTSTDLDMEIVETVPARAKGEGATTVPAQQTAPPTGAPAAPAPSMAAEKTMEGKVKAVDQAKKQLTLEDGTQFTVPAAVPVTWSQITPGTTVVVSYVESGAGKAVRKVDVKG